MEDYSIIMEENATENISDDDFKEKIYIAKLKNVICPKDNVSPQKIQYSKGVLKLSCCCKELYDKSVEFLIGKHE